MSALAQLQAGDWLTGPDGTQWRIGNADGRHDTVHLEASTGGDLWVARDELRCNLADGTFDHAHRSEADQ
jgi:hypothetical protein